MEHVGDCVWRLDSGKPGAHLMILGGVHGNEQSGIVHVRELLDQFDQSPERLTAGTLTLGFGNLAAIMRGTRGSGPHLDLNRSFTPERLAHPQTYEDYRAVALVPFLKEADVLLDLHATNKPSVPFLALTKITPAHEQIIQCFDCDRVVLNESAIIPGMAQGYVNDRGKVALVFESGQADDLTCLKAVRHSVHNVMEHLCMLEFPDDGFLTWPKERFHIRDVLTLTPAGFRFADGRGLASFEPMRAGDIIGFVEKTPVTAPYDGVLMFPKIPSLWKVGSPLVYFAAATGNY